MKQAKGTHRSMGRKGGASAGLDSGLSATEKFKAGQGIEVNSKTQRPNKVGHGSIAVK